ncbi:MAG: hypothetical protein OHK0013_16630 [Sandaracinaceae bacterium]
MTGKVLGIDLGTTNSVVAIANGRECRVLSDAEGRRLIPSVVSFHPDGSILVGHEARERRLVDAKNTVYSTKRLIGRPFSSPEVQRAKERFAFDLEPTKVGGVQVRVRRGTFALPEISAMVLRHLRRVAEDALGEPCGRAVVTVPANFNELQRSATQAAGKVAGLEVLRILNEPTAATLAYALNRGQAEKVAVYDFGGGTFDITLLDLDRDVFEVVSTAGDTFLGGDDIDLLVAEKMADACLREHRYDARSDPQAFERMRAAAEWAKCQLSTVREVDVTLEELFNDATGATRDFTFHMSRAELEQLVRPVVTRTFDVVSDALRSTGRRPKEIDSVVLVGGSSRIPLVRRMVEEFFGRPVRMDIDPDLVVAQGAAIHGFTLAGEKTSPERGKAVARVALKKNTQPMPRPEPVRKQPAFAPEHRDDKMARVIDPELPVAPARQPTQSGGIGVPATRESSARVEAAPHYAFDEDPTLVGARPEPPTRPKPAAGSFGEPDTPTQVGPAPSRSGAKDAPSASVAVIRTVGVVGTVPGPAPEPPSAIAPPVVPEGGPAPRRRRDPTLVGVLGAPEPARPKATTLPVTAAEAAPSREPSGRPRVPEVPPREPSGSIRAAEPPFPEPAPPPARALETGLELSSSAFQIDDIDPGLAETGRDPSRRAPIALDPPVPALPSAPAPPAPQASPRAPGHAPATRAPQPPAPPPLPLPFGPPPAAAAAPRQPVVVMPDRPAPLLMDVTPLSLGIETAGGYCQTIVHRNAPIPTEKSRIFATARDGQTEVELRICQGESNRFGENQALGTLLIAPLRQARRGEVRIEITFMIDQNGILDVKATDLDTRTHQAIRIELRGGVDAAEIDAMRQRQEDFFRSG